MFFTLKVVLFCILKLFCSIPHHVACSTTLALTQTEHKERDAKHRANIERMRKTIATLTDERTEWNAQNQAAETVIKDNFTCYLSLELSL